MAVEAAQGLAHHVDRHDAGLDRMFFTQSRRERSEQPLGRHIEFIAQSLGGLLELAEIVAVGLDQVAHPLDRIGLERVPSRSAICAATSVSPRRASV